MTDERVMLITGTRKGIGRYLAEYYTGRGFQVIGCSRQAPDFELDAYEHVCADIADEAEIKPLFSHIRKCYGRLDVLINNAAHNLALGPVMLVPFESARRTLETNVLGTFLMCREAGKLMMRRKHGRIINLGSMAVRHEVAGEAIYTASKAAVIAFTRVLAKEYFPYGVTCNVVAPSAIETDMLDQIDKSALNDVLSRNAIPGIGKMEDVTNTIDWLLRPESSAVTSQVIFLGGA